VRFSNIQFNGREHHLHVQAIIAYGQIIPHHLVQGIGNVLLRLKLNDLVALGFVDRGGFDKFCERVMAGKR